MQGKDILITTQDGKRLKQFKDLLIATGGNTYRFHNEILPEAKCDFLLIAIPGETTQNNPALLEHLRETYPASPILLLGSPSSSPPTMNSTEGSFVGWLPDDISADSARAIISQALQHREKLEKWAAHSAQDPMKITTRADGLLVVDRSGALQVLNSSALTILNLTRASWYGKPAASLLENDELVKLLENASDHPVKALLELSSGEFYITHVYPLPEGHKAATMHNVTQFRELESLKEEIILTVSHDLRSPLTAILGYVELIGKIGEVNDAQAEFIDRVQASVSTITQLIDALIELGQLESDYESPEDLVSIPNIIRQSIVLYEPLLDEKKHRLKLDIEEDLPPVRGNEVWLRMMVSNLIENAHKYSPAGKEIRVSARQEGKQVILQVQDEGIGIPQAEIDLVFNRQYRASNIPTDSTGSGLGLAFVQKIVENHSGRLWCDSTPGEGTTFTIVLPAISPAAAN